MSQPHFEASGRMKFTLPKLGTWHPQGFLKLQSSIAKNTSHRGVLYIVGKILKFKFKNGLA
jgi:hypothetical protein